LFLILMHLSTLKIGELRSCND